MQIHFSYQNVNPADKANLENYVTDKKLQSLIRLLRHGNFDLADLDTRVEYMSHHNNYEVKMDLKIKRHVLVSEVMAFSLTESFDLALEKIIAQLRKLESIRHHK